MVRLGIVGLPETSVLPSEEAYLDAYGCDWGWPGGGGAAVEHTRAAGRVIRLDPAVLAWNGGAVAKLASSIHADRAFERLPLLADALEDAGCTDVELLVHLRCPGPHARNCRARYWLLRA